MANEVTKEENKEITIKTAKGLVGEPFKAKDGKEYCEVKIPNKDENDKSPWATFVVRAAEIHDDKFGKGKWFKLPADGTTTISKSNVIGKNEEGKNVYENTKERLTNSELKDRVEFYKERDNDRVPFNENLEDKEPKTSFKDRLNEAKKEIASNEKAAKPKTKTKSKSKEAEL